MTLPEFRDEAEFRTTFIEPLLNRLGFILVTHSHGTDEQGKDFFFADFDRFQHMRLYAAQAKLGNIGAGSSELDALLNQVKRAFRVRVRNRKRAENRRVSAVYIMTSGTISGVAREYITDHVASEPFGENVYFVDGDMLEKLDQNTQLLSDQDVRRKLVGVLAELQSNNRACRCIRRDFSDTNESVIIPMRCRLVALNALLIEPVPAAILDQSLADEAWVRAAELNRACEVWSNMLAAGRGISDIFRSACLEFLDRAEASLLQLSAAAGEAIVLLDGRYRDDIQILDEDT